MTHERNEQEQRQAAQALGNPERNLPDAAKRALAEAAARRQAEKTRTPAREVGGRGGLDPARYGDWEIKGRAIDF